MQKINPPLNKKDLHKMILNNLGEADSKMSSVNLYLYNHWVTQAHPEISKAFLDLSTQELAHLHLLGKLAASLGADPRPWAEKGRKKVYWSPKNIRYTTKPRQIISNALYNEYLSVEKYKSQLAKIDDPEIADCLRKILQDEQAHVRLLKDLLQKL